MIRRFKFDDLDAVMTLWLEGNLTAHNFIDKKYWHAKYRAVSQLLPSADVYVYEQDGVICAFAGVSEGYVNGIFVAGDMRSQGIGGQIIAELKKIYGALSLRVYEKNHRAVKFYTRMGFHIESIGVDSETGEKEYLMMCR